jgi:hypothetical protein
MISRLVSRQAEKLKNRVVVLQTWSRKIHKDEVERMRLTMPKRQQIARR